MLIYNPPHGKIRVHPCAKNIRYSSYSCSKKKTIRVPKTFVTFAIRAIRVQRKNSIRVPKTFDIRFLC